MKDEKKKIREPYPPGETPKPPQKVHPTDRKNDSPTGEHEEASRNPKEKPAEQSGSGHLLTDDADINDETTI